MKFIHGVTATLAAQFVGLCGLVVAAFVADEISERKKKAKSEGEAAGYKRGFETATARAELERVEARARQADIERSFLAPNPNFDRITGTLDDAESVPQHSHTLGGLVATDARTPNDYVKEAREQALLDEDDRAAGNPDYPGIENEWRERHGLQPWPPPVSGPGGIWREGVGFVEPAAPPDFSR